MQVGLRTYPLRLLAVALLSGVAAGLAPAALGTAPSPLTADQGVALYVGVVGLGVLPAMVVAGWTALILHRRSHPHWLALPAAALLLDGAAVALLLVSPVSILLTWAGLLVLLCCQLIAAFAVPVRGARRRGGAAWYLAAGIVWPVSFLATLYLAVGLGEALVRRGG